MDPEEAYQRLMGAITYLRSGEGQTAIELLTMIVATSESEPYFNEAVAGVLQKTLFYLTGAAEYAEYLDGWIKNGGFLPQAWKQEG